MNFDFNQANCPHPDLAKPVHVCKALADFAADPQFANSDEKRVLRHAVSYIKSLENEIVHLQKLSNGLISALSLEER
jgi:hypothetical protein